MLATDHMSTTRVSAFKASSNSTITEARITDPATESWKGSNLWYTYSSLTKEKKKKEE